MERIELGEYIVADSKICHGALTFKGTRLFVSDVLEMVAEGGEWERIIWECHGSIRRESIAEAIRLARKALLEQSPGPKAAAARRTRAICAMVAAPQPFREMRR